MWNRRKLYLPNYFLYFLDKKLFLIGVVALLFLSGCSVRRIVVNQLEPVVDEMQMAILNEPEEIFVKDSLPFAIKFAEALYRYYPKSPYYSGKLAMLYGAYTFAYFDDTPYDDFDEEADIKIERLLRLYDKAYHFGLRSLNTRIDDFQRRILDPREVNELLAEIEEEDVEVLFWFNFTWAMKILHRLSDTEQLVHLETVKKITDRIASLQPDYFHGINTTVYIAYYGGRVDALGGNKVKAREYYERNHREYGDKSLVADFVYFRYVTTQNSDSQEFEEFYRRISSFDIQKNPDFQFINSFLKKKAEELYKKKNWLF